jgi:hypothetical protein
MMRVIYGPTLSLEGLEEGSWGDDDSETSGGERLAFLADERAEEAFSGVDDALSAVQMLEGMDLTQRQREIAVAILTSRLLTQEDVAARLGVRRQRVGEVIGVVGKKARRMRLN